MGPTGSSRGWKSPKEFSMSWCKNVVVSFNVVTWKVLEEDAEVVGSIWRTSVCHKENQAGRNCVSSRVCETLVSVALWAEAFLPIHSALCLPNSCCDPAAIQPPAEVQDTVTDGSVRAGE